MSTGTGGKTSLSARLLILLVALIIGAAAMAWALAHFPRFARTVGVNPPLQTEYLPARALSSGALAAASAATSDCFGCGRKGKAGFD